MEQLNVIPEDVKNLLLTGLLSLIIGLEQRRLHAKEVSGRLFGTDRTFTFIGILGYILFLFDSVSWRLFLGGGLILGGWLSVYYYQRSSRQTNMGITSLVLILITYCLGPCIVLLSNSMVLILVVGILILSEMKDYFKGLISKTADDEFITLAKFIAMVGIILPILPKDPLTGFEHLSLYKLFQAVVVISGISYVSYLIRKFVFTKSGEELSGALAGLYSSTAATIVISRQSNSETGRFVRQTNGILFANCAMLFRVGLLASIFNSEIAKRLIPFLLLMIIVLGVSIYRLIKKEQSERKKTIAPLTLINNPLELKVALIFASLYVLFSLATQYSLSIFGEPGLNIIAVIVGFADVDPFLMNIFQDHSVSQTSSLVSPCLIAIMSNIVLKTIYIKIWASEEVRKLALPRMLILLLCGAICLIINQFI
jgi:uncharacterized membrane protein (DUF4010 family)